MNYGADIGWQEHGSQWRGLRDVTWYALEPNNVCIGAICPAGFCWTAVCEKGKIWKLQGIHLLFTWDTTRAAHLELVKSLSLQVFLLAFRRFVARKGVSDTIHSDNGQTIKRASNHLHMVWEIMNQGEFNACITQMRIAWKLIEEVPWWHG